MVYNLEFRNFAVKKFTVNGTELGDFEITVAGNKGIPKGIRAKFYVFVNHSFT